MDLLTGILTLIGVAVVMLFISTQYTFLSLAIAPVLFLIVAIYTGGIKATARKKAKAAGKIADVATEDINALAVVRAFTLENDLYPLHILRQNISMVLQDSVLFEGTVRENIEIGRPGATLEETIEAAKKANIHDTILNLPDGYETIVREQGNNFSAGQRQRLPIARIGNRPVLRIMQYNPNGQ